MTDPKAERLARKAARQAEYRRTVIKATAFLLFAAVMILAIFALALRT